MRYAALGLIGLLLCGPAFALTVEWSCNLESDMKEYRVEYSKDAGATWGVEGTVPHPKPCTSPVSFGITRYLKPGLKMYRLFSVDTAGNVSTKPSEPASYTVKAPLIGNPGGQEEAPIPPSPYKPAPTPTPSPVVPPPTPPPVAKPGKLANVQIANIGPTSAIVTFPLPFATGVDLRLSLAQIAWGSATSVTCTGPDDLGLATCLLENLLPNRRYDLQGVYYFGVMNQGATYGELSDVVTFMTAQGTPPPVPPSPPPAPSASLKDALQSGLDICLTRKLAHTACMKALSEAVGKVAP
jgi:hypothetical protein